MNSAPPTWLLTDLFAGPDDPRLSASLSAAHAAADAFAAAYKGRLADLSPADLAGALAEWESIHQDAGKPGAFASLTFAADASPASGALLQKTREATTAATLPLLFFPIELAALGVKRLDALASDPALATYAHFLRTVRDDAAFRLSEPEERILEETANTGRRAMVRLFDETMGNLKVMCDGEEKTLSEALDLQHSPDRAVRERGAASLSQALESQSHLTAFLYNTLVQGKATEDRLRGYGFPEQSRHLANELEPSVVETVARVAESGYPLAARYYGAKRKLLGLESLAHYDRYAPLPGAVESEYSWDDARSLILGAFEAFDPAYAALGRKFFDNPWIDGAPRAGKSGGAFCSYVAPDHHPYLFANFLGKAGDVQTLAHEIGHGIHALLSAGQRPVYFYGTLPMAEVASTFAEQLVFSALLERSESPLEKRALYARRIEGSAATIFRQIAMYRFEQAVHEQRKGGELSAARIGEIWQEKVGAMFGGAVALGEGHKNWWSYVGHFVHTPFYVYAYAFGELLALALYVKWREEGADFAAKYLRMLALAGSQPPQTLVRPLGIDLSDESFWRGALQVLEEEVTRFEALI